MKLYANIYWKKNGPNNRLIKERKMRQFAQRNLKEGPVESQLALSSSPARLILTKYKQLCTIVLIHCYHQPMLLWVSFLKATVLK